MASKTQICGPLAILDVGPECSFIKMHLNLVSFVTLESYSGTISVKTKD